MTRIEVKSLTKIINKTTVLEDVTISMQAGKIYGLQGINGSGKTMLMRHIIGLVRPTKGSISIDGKMLGKEMEFPESIGFLLENPSFLNSYTGYENLKMLASIQNKTPKEKIAKAMIAVGLNPDDKKKYRKYSLGMKQRLGIACGIMEEPDIIILDEPTNSLDSDGIELVKTVLLEQKKRGALIIIACHDLAVLQEMSDEIIELRSGKVVEHNQDALLNGSVNYA